MPITLFLATSLFLDPWDIKPPITGTTKSEWAVSIDAESGGQSHTATFDLSEAGKDGGTATAPAVKLEMANVMVETQTVPGASVDGVVNSQNALQSTADDDGNRRMFAPLIFMYPSAPVNVGDTWKLDVTPTTKDAHKISLEFTAKAIEQVNGADALQVTSKLKEDMPDGETADGTWWLDKTGKVIKFKITVKNWFVTMTNGATVDGTMTGKLKTGS